jgi:hypothetical protein
MENRTQSIYVSEGNVRPDRLSHLYDSRLVIIPEVMQLEIKKILQERKLCIKVKNEAQYLTAVGCLFERKYLPKNISLESLHYPVFLIFMGGGRGVGVLQDEQDNFVKESGFTILSLEAFLSWDGYNGQEELLM